MISPQQVDPEVVRCLLIGACPERSSEIDDCWNALAPEFYVKPDSSGATISAHHNRISWMHKSLALDWAVASLGMTALKAYIPYIVLSSTLTLPSSDEPEHEDAELLALESQMDETLYFTKSVRLAENLDDLDWPSGIPAPGTFPESSSDHYDKATYDLACLAAAATFFHELRHVQFAKEINSPALSVDEEHACDKHARDMLLNRISDYCCEAPELYARVLDKRLMGLATAALCISHAETVGMQAAISATHPTLKARFLNLVMSADADEHSFAWLYTACILIHLLRNQRRLNSDITFSSAKQLCAQLVDLL